MRLAFVGSIQLDPRNGLAQGFDRGFQILALDGQPGAHQLLHLALQFVDGWIGMPPRVRERRR